MPSPLTAQPADEHYMAAQARALDAARALPRRRLHETPGGTSFRVYRPLLRFPMLVVYRWLPGQDRPAAIAFQRNGRVEITSGPGSVPIGTAARAGHDPWVSRGDLEELARQLRQATSAR